MKILSLRKFPPSWAKKAHKAAAAYAAEHDCRIVQMAQAAGDFSGAPYQPACQKGDLIATFIGSERGARGWDVVFHL